MARPINEIRRDLDAAREKRTRLHDECMELVRAGESRQLSDGEATRMQRLDAGASNAQAEVERLNDEWRDAMQDIASRGGANAEPSFGAALQTITRTTQRENDAVRSQALRIVDKCDHLEAAAGDQLVAAIRSRDVNLDGDYIARRTLLTENDAYRSAFARLMVHGWTGAMLSAEEVAAVRALQEFEVSRAMAEGTDAAGGYGVPVSIDPSLIFTSGAADAPILKYARIVQTTSRVWRPITTAPPTWSWDAEASAVSDDSMTLSSPLVTSFMARGFVPYSIEVSMDYRNFVQEIAGALTQGYVDLIAAATMSGNGTTQPRGLFTALDANTNVEVVTTTDGSFGGVDIFKVWNALPERARSRSTWVMSVPVESAIRQLSTPTSPSAYFTVDLTESGISRINGRPVVVTDYAPLAAAASIPGTTGAANVLAVGDMNNFIITQRAGMSIEQIPHLFDTTTNTPTGQRGSFAWARLGSNVVADNLFRLLQNQ